MDYKHLYKNTEDGTVLEVRDHFTDELIYSTLVVSKDETEDLKQLNKKIEDGILKEEEAEEYILDKVDAGRVAVAASPLSDVQKGRLNYIFDAIKLDLAVKSDVDRTGGHETYHIIKNFSFYSIQVAIVKSVTVVNPYAGYASAFVVADLLNYTERTMDSALGLSIEGTKPGVHEELMNQILNGNSGDWEYSHITGETTYFDENGNVIEQPYTSSESDYLSYYKYSSELTKAQLSEDGKDIEYMKKILGYLVKYGELTLYDPTKLDFQKAYEIIKNMDLSNLSSEEQEDLKYLIGKEWLIHSESMYEAFEEINLNGIIQKDWLFPDLFDNATTAQVIRRDPLVLDLDGDGIEIDPLGSGANFDLDRNGFAEETAWVNKDDGLLVLDRNSDGIINDGGELFGDQTTLADGTIASTGFEALTELDTNGDGIISSEDEKFADLRVWQDTNSDGFTDDGELKTLEELGITAIDLANQTVNKDIAKNNTIVREGIYYKEDGTLGNVGELLFERDTLNTEGNEVRENEDDINQQLLENLEVAFLPDFKGYGTVHSLRYSMLQNEELQNLVTSFAGEEDIDTRRKLLQEILEIWTENTEVDPSSRGGNIDGQKLAILEGFMGEKFVGVSGENPNTVAASLLNRAYSNLFNTIYYTLLMQEQMAEVGYLLGSEGEEFSGIGAYLGKMIEADVMVGIDFYRELTGAATTFGWAEIESYKEMKADITAEYNFLANPQAIYTGTSEEDNLIGDIGANVMIGSRGDDLIQGGFGNDTYIFNRGDGSDIIYDGFYTKGSKYEQRNYSEYGPNYSGGTDTLVLGDGITSEDIEVVRDGKHLIIGIKEEGIAFEDLLDKITIEGWFDKKLRVESLKFADGSQMDVGYLVGLSLGDELETFEASGNSITLQGTDKHNVIETLEGNDILDGGKGKDILSAGAGDDFIIGGEGNDTLIGGRGTDELFGGKGNDTYIYNSGDGLDTIHDIYTDNGSSENSKKNDKHNSGGNDTLILKDGIIAEDLLIKREGSDLLIGVLEGDSSFEDLTNKIVIKDGINSSTMIENLEVDDINYSMERLIQAMAELLDEGIIDFGKVSRDLEDKSKISDISSYLYNEEEEKN